MGKARRYRELACKNRRGVSWVCRTVTAALSDTPRTLSFCKFRRLLLLFGGEDCCCVLSGWRVWRSGVCWFALPMAMHTSPGCAFSLPPCAAIGRVYGDHRVLPSDTPRRSHSINAPHVLQAVNQREWRPLAYRSGRRLAERRTRRRGTQQRQQSVGGIDPAEYREGEAFPLWRQQQQEVEERVLPPPPATAPSSLIAGEHEELVILDDPFEELEGDRRRHPCVVHDTLAAEPTPYNDGWEWQKQVREGRSKNIGNDDPVRDAQPWAPIRGRADPLQS